MLRNTLNVLIMGLVVLGCSAENHPERQRIVIYAASSLTDVLRDLESRFEKSYPDIDVAVAFSGSQTLRLQIEQGAQADIFISANPKHIASLVSTGRIEQPEVFAYNRLAVVVPKANPAGIQTPAELIKAKRLVIGNTEVPIGKYTRQWFAKMDDTVGSEFSEQALSKVVSLENNVRLLRAKVELGEVDAAVVYLTDALSSTELEYLAIDPKTNIRAEYQLGIVVNPKSSQVALDKWLSFLRLDETQQVLAQAGWDLP